MDPGKDFCGRRSDPVASETRQFLTTAFSKHLAEINRGQKGILRSLKRSVLCKVFDGFLHLHVDLVPEISVAVSTAFYRCPAVIEINVFTLIVTSIQKTHAVKYIAPTAALNTCSKHNTEQARWKRTQACLKRASPIKLASYPSIISIYKKRLYVQSWLLSAG